MLKSKTKQNSLVSSGLQTSMLIVLVTFFAASEHQTQKDSREERVIWAHSFYGSAPCVGKSRVEASSSRHGKPVGREYSLLAFSFSKSSFQDPGPRWCQHIQGGSFLPLLILRKLFLQMSTGVCLSLLVSLNPAHWPWRLTKTPISFSLTTR